MKYKMRLALVVICESRCVWMHLTQRLLFPDTLLYSGLVRKGLSKSASASFAVNSTK